MSQEISNSEMLDAHTCPGEPETIGRQCADVPIVARGRSRLALNLLANAANVAVNVFVGVWFTRYLIKYLGVSAYGLVPLVSQVVSYFALLTLSLNSTVGRYLTISLEQGDAEEANRFFNTSVFGSLIASAVLLVPGILIALHPEVVFNIPAGHLPGTRWLVAGTVGAFVIGLLASPFDVASFCRNRFDVRNLVAVGSVVVRVAVVIALFNTLGARLSSVAVGVFCGAAAAAVGAVLVWVRLMPMLRIDIRGFSTATLRRLVSTGGWIVVNQIGSVLYLSIDLLIVNRLMDPESGGRYAAVLQWSGLLRALAGAVAGVFAPTMFCLFARSDIQGLIRYSRNSVRLSGMLMALPIALTCGFARPLLALWLGPDFAVYAPLLMLMTFTLSINLGVMPLFSIQVATNRVEWPGIITLVMGMANLGLALLLAGPVGWGMYGVAAAGAIMLTAKNAIFTPLYAAWIIGAKMRTFQMELVQIVGVTTVATLLCWGLTVEVSLASWSRLLAAAGTVSTAYAFAVYYLVLSSGERDQIRRMLSARSAKVNTSV